MSWQPRRQWTAWITVDAWVVIALAWVLSKWFIFSLSIGVFYMCLAQGQFRVDNTWPIYLDAAPELKANPAKTFYWNFSLQLEPYFALALPLWIPLAILIPLAVWLFRRAYHTPPAVCRSCGYDLTGNVSGECPECGTAVPAGAAHEREQPQGD
jgi:predicted RNA-binding Zn-ribbon protein involved in translation (DUF1610 family)